MKSEGQFFVHKSPPLNDMNGIHNLTLLRL
jgi:hypothetical protein